MFIEKFKKWTSILLIVCSFAVFSGCARGNAVSDASNTDGNKQMSKLDEIKKSGKLVVGTSADYPPSEFHKEINGKDEIVGFDISIAKEIAKDLGVELQIKDMKFDGLLAALNAGNIDIVLAGMVPTEERKKSVDFSNVYYTGEQGILVRAEDNGKYKSIGDFKGKKVGVQKGALQEKIAQEQFKESEIKPVGSVSDLVLQLKSKKVDAVLVGAAVGKAYANKNKDLAMTDIKIEYDYNGTAVAVKKGNQDLVDSINKTIDRLKKDGLIEKYYAEATEMAEN
ncbi:transporter substrate-binding domain-containing protein [Fonticella tunisiensis]|uniref:Polar amino acid transport system substrate-binding protein n=1 Tax=Fonticella tunisiensis TaxID=1096341 RepID=A0A4R7KTD0_9CLOT|nr:transporter substrate-binding domain-containing protein [Fonticella tunisiensis]TDT62298.1 polar amino acid transport system substrate-binding protein [Fonticella tunisiensis]